MGRSIRYYFFTSIAAVLVTSVLVMGLIQIYVASSYFSQDKERQLQQVVDGVSTGVRAGQIDVRNETRWTINFMANMSGIGVFVADSSGQIIYCTEDVSEFEGEAVDSNILRLLDHDGAFIELGRAKGLFPSNFYIVAAPLEDQNGQHVGYVFAASDATGLKIYLSDMLSSFVLSAIFVMMLSSIVALILFNRTVIPIRRVSEAAKQFGEGDYSTRVPVEGDDELAQLAITFNEMARSFEATDTSRRSFMGNIAHELRTPMTSIKGFIDGMLDGTIPEDQRDKYLAIVSEEVGRLARLTSNMLDISKLETGEYTPNTTNFDIWMPVATVCIGAEQRVTEKHIDIEGLSDNKPVLVQADEDFVHQILYNLVDNAIKFTPDHGTLSIKVESAKGFATIHIRNTGDGIPEDVLPHIFDRFYKADKSRGVNAGGSGLGLHICKVLLNLMGGRIWVDSETGQWAEFSFTLPLYQQKRNVVRGRGAH